jgi:predicted nucleic acid-binding protein
MSGVSPLRLKTSSRISEILKEHEPLEFIHNFKVLDMDEEIINKSNYFMINYNLLPNDALIFATCRIYGIKYLVSFDSDFQEICKKEEIVLINSMEKFIEVEGGETQKREEVEKVDNGDE